MSKVAYVETTCKSLLNRVQGMPFRWSVNPYRGCPHGCRYCYATVTHDFLHLPASDFGSVIQVKTNAAEILRAELARPGWKRERVAINTATDGYQPIEGRYRITRACLTEFALGRTPISLVTKGTMVVRDIDLFHEIDRVAEATICLSLPTIDKEVSARLEPGTPPPWQRLRAMQALAAAGLRVGVLIAPMIPGLTTRRGHLEDLVRQAAASGAQFIGADLLHLRPGVREPFLDFLLSDYPNLLPGYHRLYRGAHADGSYRQQLLEVVNELKATVGLLGERAAMQDARLETDSRASRQLAFWTNPPDHELVVRRSSESTSSLPEIPFSKSANGALAR